MRSWISSFSNRDDQQDSTSKASQPAVNNASTGPASDGAPSGPVAPYSSRDSRVTQSTSDHGEPGTRNPADSAQRKIGRDNNAKNVSSSRETSYPQHPQRPARKENVFAAKVMNTFSSVGGSFYQDAEMERRVTKAAKSLGEEVQNIVKAAQGRSQNQDEWKIRLLDLLGGEGPEGRSHIDILLNNSPCSKFVQKCVENELPPNLIHCLRLLRVLELQHSHVSAGSDSGAISTVATTKVSKLLALLCTDPVVGEQLRPHLFGLLALSGASYPTGGVHIASAASNVVIAFADSCLSSSLVWFLHDKKMIVNMTDDIKELCGMTAVSSASVTTCLYGQAAEEVGLWVVALRTVIYLVTKSTEHQCLELLKDFEEAEGYDVLCHAILHSSHKHVPKLLELLLMLVCCEATPEVAWSGSPAEEGEANREETPDSKLATNVDALETITELMARCVPFLAKYAEDHQGKRPLLTEESLKDLAAYSVDTATTSLNAQDHGSSSSPLVDLSSELLVATLQLYSDHTRNYSIVEPRQNVLSLFLLAFPTFSDDSVKVLILKTLEYVCTGLVDAKSLTPLEVANEILFSIFSSLFEAKKGPDKLADVLLQDAQLLCNTMEKLVHFDQSMSGVLSGYCLSDERLADFLERVVDLSASSTERSVTSSTTGFDKAYATVCRFLKLTVCQDQASDLREIFSRLKVNKFLTTGIKSLGDDACRAALSVFETVMCASRDIIATEMSCIIEVLTCLMEDTNTQSIIRETEILQMLKVVLEGNEHAQDAFRTSGGFESVVCIVVGLKGVVSEVENEEDPPVMPFLEAVFALIAASTTPPSSEKQLGVVTAAASIKDKTTRDDAVAWVANRRYLCQSRFYKEFASASAGTGILLSSKRASSLLNMSLALLDPNLPIIKETMNTEAMAEYLPNADATRLVLGVALQLPPLLFDLGKRALDEILRLCAPDKSGSSLSLMSSSGLIGSLTSPTEFGAQLEDRTHPLYSRCMLLLRRVAAFSMIYTDYVALLRFMAGPILKDSESISHQGIRLPVISSSLHIPLAASASTESQLSPDRRAREADFCTRLETLSIIAERGERVARFVMGGDSLNTVALYMQKVPLEERLYKLAEEGRTKFIEVPQVSSTASLASTSDEVPAEKVWFPFSSTGFSYSMWLRLPESVGEAVTGSIFLLDISCNSGSFLSFWYDLQQQQVCILSSASSRNEPSRFPLTPLTAGVWHHILFTYQLSKRAVLMRKAIVSMFVDGRSVEPEVKVDNVNVLPTARIHVGVPCPKLAASGIVRGSLPFWELGPCLMVSSVLTSRDVTAIFAAGPEYEGLFWGDRPQRLSFTASATSLFAMLADSGEEGSVACALKRRQVPEVEAAGHVMRERGSHDDSLSTAGLLCCVNPDDVVFGLHSSASARNARGSCPPERGQIRSTLFNIARQKTSDNCASDAYLYGVHSSICPHSFAENLQWVGGPKILLPLVNATQTAASLSLALRLIRAAVDRHPPNLESLQAGGGYRTLGLLLRQKRVVNSAVLDQCFAFAVHGFVPGSTDGADSGRKGESSGHFSAESENWVFTDLDAMKYLLINHQIWDLRRCGPDITMRLLSLLNGLVAAHNIHAAFNARRLHLLGIVQWVLHLMLEAAVLYSTDDGFDSFLMDDISGTQRQHSSSGNGSRWQVVAPAVSSTAVGGDPDNALLLGCKTILRRVLTYMLTPGDLDAAAGSAIYTLSISENQSTDVSDGEKLPPGPVARVYILRLLEELVVDGVNEIVMANKGSERGSEDENRELATIHPHAGGGTTMNQPYLSLARKDKRPRPQSANDPTLHQSHQQAQAFLAAFSGILTPNWFACILEGCREEASASAAFRLMILLLQSSPTFAASFEEAGGFAPLVLSIPKFSTCPSIILSMLSQLLHAPILHLPCLASLDAEHLCEVFDAESDSMELCMIDSTQGGLQTPSDPSCGIFALLAECLGRNIQLSEVPGDVGKKARATNEAVLRLLGHRHTFSSSFQEFCRTRDFLEPLAQALCLVHEEMVQTMSQEGTGNGYDDTRTAPDDQHSGQGRISEDEIGITQEDAFMSWPSGSDLNGRPAQHGAGALRRNYPGDLSGARADKTATELFVGGNSEGENSGIGMVQLLQLIVSHAVHSSPLAASLISALFHSFPIHATPDQVEAFHLLLIEHCIDVVGDALQRGELFALANCIGVASVFLDRLMAGFFNAETVLQTVRMVLHILRCLTTTGSYATRSLAVADQNMLVADCAHMARLTCLTALQRSRPRRRHDHGDDDLKLGVLHAIGEHLGLLLLAPSVGNENQKAAGGSASPYSYTPPSAGNTSYAMWQSASLARCPAAPVLCAYPELKNVEQPDRAFVISLMAEIHICLIDKTRTDTREQSAFLVVSLIEQCSAFMSELLIKDISQGSRTETVDLMNRGGFGALVAEHTKNVADSSTATSRPYDQKKGSGNDDAGAGNLQYAQCFEWLERNEAQVAAVFHDIHLQASRQLTGTDGIASTPNEAIEKEQKVMLLKLTSQDSSDRTILGGLERAELAQHIHEQMAESHALWKRQGFDDIASGTTQWKVLLRQLKGPLSIWEGGTTNRQIGMSPFSRERLLSGASAAGTSDPVEDGEADETGHIEEKGSSLSDQTRWKLDLTEGYERQRRRLLPNHEFYGLYNIDDGTQSSRRVVTSSIEDSNDLHDKGNQNRQSISFPSLVSSAALGNAENVDATTALLKEMHIKSKNIYEEEEDEKQFDDETVTSSDTRTGLSPLGNADDADAARESVTSNAYGDPALPGSSSDANDAENQNNEDIHKEEFKSDEDIEAEVSGRREGSSASSYDLVTGLLEPGDWPEKSYNVKRCTGLEVRKALLLWCREAIYIVDGFEQTEGDGLEGKINRLEMSTSTFYVNIRDNTIPSGEDSAQVQGGGTGLPDSSLEGSTSDVNAKGRKTSKEDSAATSLSEGEITYQHRSQRIAFTDLFSVYKRRYQLQHIALEFYDVHRNGILVAFQTQTEREEVLSKVLSCPLPNSIFHSSSLGGGSSINYDRFMASLRAKIVSQWVNGRMSNFEFIMHLNSFAGRSYNDLTQYPVFPWVLSDYESETIDLNDPKVYRDLSKPMGAQGETRAKQFRERFESLEANCNFSRDEPPPFHYGTHYSCAAYVLYYLMRLEPFSRLALSLQGGKFDVADRLFHNIKSSWCSAARDNLQDVRELIPEFFYLPEFLVNSNMFDYGETQGGLMVHDVTLPPWARGDAQRFIRINRQALESEYVSRSLHLWIDLIFGYKQRGREAVKAQNTFVHLTYEGAVDLEAIADPVQREATIAQIHNFGQTPSRLERRPFPQQNVVVVAKERTIDFNAVQSLAYKTPPFCVVGAPHRVHMNVTLWDTCRVGMMGQADSSVGDMCLVKGQIVGVGRCCALILPSKTYYRYGGANNGVSVHVAISSARGREVDRVLSIHDGMHRSRISTLKPSLNGNWVVTGCTDSTVRVWRNHGKQLHLQATLCGHEGGAVTSIDVSTTFGTIVTGGADGNVLVWDLRRLTFVRHLYHYRKERQSDWETNKVVSVSINHKNGNIFTLVGNRLRVFDMNGNLLGVQDPAHVISSENCPTCAVATDCPEWMENGVVAVSGHKNGDVRLWSLNNDSKLLEMRYLVQDKVHSCAITALRTAGERQDTLLVGDMSGKMSLCKTLRLDGLNQQELSVILKELKAGEATGGSVGTRR